jgi:hypothetical protein
MTKRSAGRFTLRAALSTAALAVLLGGHCPKPPKVANPDLTAFSVAPNRLCVNVGVPIVRLAWSVRGGEVRTCMSFLKVNGTGIDPAVFGPQGIDEGRCGSGDYDREVSFSLRDVFGNNIPSQVTITGDLTRQNQAGVFVGGEVVESGSASLTTETCTPGVTPG